MWTGSAHVANGALDARAPGAHVGCRVRWCTTGKMVEKQRGASNRRQRIGNPFPGNVRRCAVHWLEQGMLFTQGRRRRQTQPAAPGACNVRQNIAEQVGGDDDIKPFGAGGELEIGRASCRERVLLRV